MTNLTDTIYNDEEAARAYFERIRWPSGRVCPHCGTIGNSVLLKGKSTRPGLYKCRDCRKPFSATIGTVYERSHIPLHKWLLATHLMVSSKKGISSHQLYRSLGFGSYRTAWFMAMRIREAMREGGFVMGGEGEVVEADETFIGVREGMSKQHAAWHKMPVVILSPPREPPKPLIRRGQGDPRIHSADRSGQCGPRDLRHDRREPHLHGLALQVSRSRHSEPPRANMVADASTPTRLRGSFRFSSAACEGFISIVASIICTATSLNLTSDNHREACGFDHNARAVKAIQGDSR